MKCGNRKIFFSRNSLEEQKEKHDCVMKSELNSVASKCRREHEAIKDIEIHLDTLLFSNHNDQLEAVSLANQACFARQVIEDLQMRVNAFSNKFGHDNECIFKSEENADIDDFKP